MIVINTQKIFKGQLLSKFQVKTKQVLINDLEYLQTT